MNVSAAADRRLGGVTPVALARQHRHPEPLPRAPDEPALEVLHLRVLVGDLDGADVPAEHAAEVKVEGLVVHDGDARGALGSEGAEGCSHGWRSPPRRPEPVAGGARYSLFLHVCCPGGAEASRDSQGATWPAPTRRFSCTSSSRPNAASLGSPRTFASGCTSTWAASSAARRVCSTRSAGSRTTRTCTCAGGRTRPCPT